jgi:hypothetical protein
MTRKAYIGLNRQLTFMMVKENFSKSLGIGTLFLNHHKDSLHYLTSCGFLADRCVQLVYAKNPM